jgi:hypothetical protein
MSTKPYKRRLVGTKWGRYTVSKVKDSVPGLIVLTPALNDVIIRERYNVHDAFVF